MQTTSTTRNKVKIYFRVNGVRIDAHWNSFRTVEEAWKTFEHTIHNVLLDKWELVVETIVETSYEVERL